LSHKSEKVRGKIKAREAKRCREDGPTRSMSNILGIS